MRKYIFIFFGLVVLAGCSYKVPADSSQTEQSIKSLYALLVHLPGSPDPREAKDLAQTAVLATQNLACEYGIISPPLLHNCLVNAGVKKRGLCYQWCDDLSRPLRLKHFKSFDLYAAGANVGDCWREHNALVVTAKGQSFATGILLDGWRGSGRLFFIPVAKDNKYKWAVRTD